MFIFCICIGIQSSQVTAQNTLQAVELGKVNWLRSLDKGLAIAKKEKKSIFILFQEVPGCSTCQNYGKDVLSHPLIVEAIESLFVPVAIFNNKGGEDAKTLRFFNEPSWNNPVARIVNFQKQDIIPRLGGNYTQLGIVQAIILALEKENRTIPVYLHLLKDELLAQKYGTEKATLSMFCFWTGEKTFGKIEGVTATQPGFMGGKEVVEVTFDPSIISYDELLQKAKRSNCANHAYTSTEEQEQSAENLLGNNHTSSRANFSPDKDPKFYLSKTIYKHVPMTELQATKANSLVGDLAEPDVILSPRQLALASYFRNHPNKRYPNAIGEDLVKAWQKVEHYLKP